MNTTTKPAAPAEPYQTLEQRVTHLANTYYSQKVVGDGPAIQKALGDLVALVRSEAPNGAGERTEARG